MRYGIIVDVHANKPAHQFVFKYTTVNVKNNTPTIPIRPARRGMFFFTQLADLMGWLSSASKKL
jgi:hypothetical protein